MDQECPVGLDWTAARVLHWGRVCGRPCRSVLCALPLLCQRYRCGPVDSGRAQLTSSCVLWLAAPSSPLGVSPFTLPQKFEEIYLKECAKSRPAPEAKFNYAWALIRSPSRPDMRKGVIMMSGLLEDRFSDRDCLYYMALGHYRLDDVVVRLARVFFCGAGGGGGPAMGDATAAADGRYCA